ncbi:MAG: DNA double-strand break repair nuclease NurA [Halobacteria archaeon]
MALDPVHFDGIKHLSTRINSDYDTSEQNDYAERLWKLLDPLLIEGEKVFEPVEDLKRLRADPEDSALSSDQYPTQHGIDSGTLNPRVMDNGLIIDVAHAAAGSVPGDLDLHRQRTVIASVYSGDSTAIFDEDWISFDMNSSRGRVVQVPGDLKRRIRDAVHSYALYLAESIHALRTFDKAEDLVILDGPLYPKNLLNHLETKNSRLERSNLTEKVLDNYLELTRRSVESDIPLLGFVKNVGSRTLVKGINESDGMAPCPWSNDDALLRRVLDGEGHGDNDDLFFTNWFRDGLPPVNGDPSVLDTGTEAPESGGKLLEGDDFEPMDLSPCCFFIRDPRRDRLFKVEALRYFVEDATVREKITKQVLKEVANDGVPRCVAKADELARIPVDQKKGLIDELETTMGTRENKGYDRERWGLGTE